MPVCMAPPPPAIYDHAPVESYRVLEMASQYMQELYQKDPSYDGGTLCGFARPSAHVVYILKGSSPGAYAAVLRHEIGHLNGWRHPG